jgi:hypothetical protein
VSADQVAGDDEQEVGQQDQGIRHEGSLPSPSPGRSSPGRMRYRESH